MFLQTLHIIPKFGYYSSNLLNMCFSTVVAGNYCRDLASSYFGSRTMQLIIFLVAIGSIFPHTYLYSYTVCSLEGKEAVIPIDQLKYKILAVGLLEIVVSVVMIIDLILALAYSPSTYGFLLSWVGICDIITTIPILYIAMLFCANELLYPSHISDSLMVMMAIIQFAVGFRLAKVTRIGLFHRKLNMPVTAYRTIVMIVGILIYIISCVTVFITIEYFHDGAFSDSICQWHNALYFTVTTISTVGFGDIVPTAAASRIFTLIVILGALLFIPYLISQVMHNLSVSPYSLSLTVLPGDHWVCICGGGGGDVGIIGASLVQEMLHELSRDDEHRACILVILSMFPPSDEMRKLMQYDVSAGHRVQYFIGSSKDFADLARVKVEWASAVYIIGDSSLNCGLKGPQAFRNREDSIYLSCIALQSYLGPFHPPPATKLAAYGGNYPVIIARLPYTARNKDLLLSRGHAHAAVRLQVLNLTNLNY